MFNTEEQLIQNKFSKILDRIKEDCVKKDEEFIEFKNSLGSIRCLNCVDGLTLGCHIANYGCHTKHNPTPRNNDYPVEFYEDWEMEEDILSNEDKFFIISELMIVEWHKMPEPEVQKIKFINYEKYYEEPLYSHKIRSTYDYLDEEIDLYIAQREAEKSGAKEAALELINIAKGVQKNLF